MASHLLSAGQFTRRDQLQAVYQMAEQARHGGLLSYTDNLSRAIRPLEGKTVVGFFDEPTTRTGPSFHAATVRLGGHFIGHCSGDSSMKKGESFSDSLRTLSAYGDVLVARGPGQGEIHHAAAKINKPVINAGDGAGEHPTQALLDLYTVQRYGDIDGMTFLMTGDLSYSRTIRSLLKLLSLYEAKVVLAFPHPDSLFGDISKCIPRERLTIISERELPEWLPKADAIYMTRYQKEREGMRPQSRFVMTPTVVNEYLKKDVLLLSPLPKLQEIDPRVDDMPQAKYWEQVENGVWIRMALLYMVTVGTIGTTAWDSAKM